jgi:hypothetical protein
VAVKVVAFVPPNGSAIPVVKVPLISPQTAFVNVLLYSSRLFGAHVNAPVASNIVARLERDEVIQEGSEDAPRRLACRTGA